jgi:hypothetical protein
MSTHYTGMGVVMAARCGSRSTRLTTWAALVTCKACRARMR